jgi:parallel beta-helix repeat protein
MLFSRYTVPVTAAVHYVPSEYPTIQAAIDASNPGDTIMVANGTYYENIVVDKWLKIRGENRSNTVIDGRERGNVVTIKADKVEISGFTIRNGGNNYVGVDAAGFRSLSISHNVFAANEAGIDLWDSDGNIIINNVFFNNTVNGIYLLFCLGNEISNNTFYEGNYGIRVELSNNTYIAGNNVTNASYGIYITRSTNNTVIDNTLSSNSFGVTSAYGDNIIIRNNRISGSTYGIYLYQSTEHSLTNNTVSNNPSYGIYLAYSHTSTLKGNTLTENDWGITLYGSTSNLIVESWTSHNTYGFYVVSDSNQNKVYHNNFVDNAKQAYADLSSSNTWDDGKHGNYWSDYKGGDSDENGIGDTAYVINTVNKDSYPLMAPWGVHDVAVTNVTVSATEVHQGQSVNITVTVKNEGFGEGLGETFNVTVKYNLTQIDVQTVHNLTAGVSLDLTFIWNTTSVDAGNYTISGEASVVAFETDTADNIFVDGTVNVKPAHDVAVVDVEVTPRSVTQGQTVYINVTVQNQGGFTESFSVYVYADKNLTVVGDETVIGQQSVSNLEPGANKTLNFAWSTWVALGEYWISARASVVEFETDVSDNLLINGVVRVSAKIEAGGGGRGSGGDYRIDNF